MSAVAFHESFDTTTELVRARVERGDRELASHRKLASPSTFLGRVTSRLFFHFENLVIGHLERRSIEFKDGAIWFKGVAREMTEEGFDPTKTNPVLLAKLDRFKGHLLEARIELLKLREAKAASLAVRQAAIRAANGLTELFDAVEGLRWCLLELEADHAKRNEGWTAGSPEAVAELFKRIKQTA